MVACFSNDNFVSFFPENRQLLCHLSKDLPDITSEVQEVHEEVTPPFDPAQ